MIIEPQRITLKIQLEGEKEPKPYQYTFYSSLTDASLKIYTHLCAIHKYHFSILSHPNLCIISDLDFIHYGINDDGSNTIIYGTLGGQKRAVGNKNNVSHGTWGDVNPKFVMNIWNKKHKAMEKQSQQAAKEQGQEKQSFFDALLGNRV